MSAELIHTPMPAIVARATAQAGAAASYLVLSAAGAPDWTQDPHSATAFASMREAARMALRLPAALRAYGLPRSGDLALN
jgi:hypothetical protein